ncbi:MAG: hypothetical protein IBX55_01145 [Methyloprofundus sp.]|nr:hypothetical protein [Methyloprofundus sp.]
MKFCQLTRITSEVKQARFDFKLDVMMNDYDYGSVNVIGAPYSVTVDGQAFYAKEFGALPAKEYNALMSAVAEIKLDASQGNGPYSHKHVHESEWMSTFGS